MIFVLLSVVAVLACTSCGSDDWGNDNKVMEHIYYIHFKDYGPKMNNDKVYTISRGETLTIQQKFESVFTRSYDAETYYWVVSDLTLGVDYEVVDAGGNSIKPREDGAYVLTWPQTRGGIQNVYIKALSGQTGSVTVQTVNPKSTVRPDATKLETTIQHTESQYEVRIETQNYKVTVNIK